MFLHLSILIYVSCEWRFYTHKIYTYDIYEGRLGPILYQLLGIYNSLQLSQPPKKKKKYSELHPDILGLCGTGKNCKNNTGV